MSCCENNASLKIIFKETSRCHKPVLHTNNLDDIETLSKVLSFVNDYCLSLDACASSRICTDICFFESLMSTPFFPPHSPQAVLKKYFTCSRNDCAVCPE